MLRGPSISNVPGQPALLNSSLTHTPLSVKWDNCKTCCSGEEKNRGGSWGSPKPLGKGSSVVSAQSEGLTTASPTHLLLLFFDCSKAQLSVSTLSLSHCFLPTLPTLVAGTWKLLSCLSCSKKSFAREAYNGTCLESRHLGGQG